MSDLTKKCHACGMEIPYDAQICPYCRTLQPKQKGKTLLNIIGGIVLFMIFLAGIGNTCTSSDSDGPTSQESAKEVKPSIDLDPVSSVEQSKTSVPTSSNEKKSTSTEIERKPVPQKVITSEEVKETSKPIESSLDDKASAVTTEEAVVQEEPDIEKQKNMDKTEKQIKREERKKERQARRNNKQS
ncbi:MAG: hypothetical protein MR292_00985 [Alistipes sp.]|nr:hypothetical protein [Alistipes sp.]